MKWFIGVAYMTELNPSSFITRVGWDWAVFYGLNLLHEKNGLGSFSLVGLLGSVFMQSMIADIMANVCVACCIETKK